ncbi:hypothetical protein BDP55DRAFT_719579 [Colletotrichum godetiae]|uniref:Uncharacterized protein n=1 Tax=Colletotrichum godetiae TaxID=1209918 RepID=A0AAJ0AAW0_9PEZI|nr:uncharacterized protein BDP55DRAFT_719579 [Colletotrichum godetiae]KAK1659765.1 hypothetical protein BDP55DRAFT_719579 [Colletotrichum godetiae]
MLLILDSRSRIRCTTVSVARGASSQDRCKKIVNMSCGTPFEGRGFDSRTMIHCRPGLECNTPITPFMSAQPSFLMRGQLHHFIDKPGVPLPTLRELGLDKFLTKAEKRDSQQDLEENESPAMIHSGPQARPQRDGTSYSRPYSSSATYNEPDKACNSSYSGSGRSWGLIYQTSIVERPCRTQQCLQNTHYRHRREAGTRPPYRSNLPHRVSASSGANNHRNAV